MRIIKNILQGLMILSAVIILLPGLTVAGLMIFGDRIIRRGEQRRG